jgi:hypothetical protein
MLTPISFLAFTLLCIHQVLGWTTFVVPHNSSGGDDMPTLTAAFVSSNGTTRNLAVNSTIIFKKGITYNFFSAIRLPVLHNVEIRIEGNMSYLEDIAALQGRLPWYILRLGSFDRIYFGE